VEQVCRCCGKVFTANYIAKVPYCSKECRKERRRRICQECGKVYYPTSKSICCSKGCLGKYRNRISIEKRKRVCETCGKEFIMPYMSGKGKRGESNEGRFCSKKCYGVWLSEKMTDPVKKQHGFKEGATCRIYISECPTCKQKFTAKDSRKKYCSYGCMYDHNKKNKVIRYENNWKQREPFKCSYCGKLHIPTYRDTSSVYCSVSCRKRAERKIKRCQTNAYVRKSAERNGERFDPMDVLVRDGWRCQLCGKKLNPKHRGSYRDDAPELDHIIPLSQGGEHSKRNTQCACRKCNLAKGSMAEGQLLLFG